MRKSTPQRAARQSRRDDKIRKANVRLKKALKRAYGGARRGFGYRRRGGPSFPQAAASSLSIGALLAASPALMDRVFGTPAEIARGKRERGEI